MRKIKVKSILKNWILLECSWSDIPTGRSYFKKKNWLGKKKANQLLASSQSKFQESEPAEQSPTTSLWAEDHTLRVSHIANKDETWDSGQWTLSLSVLHQKYSLFLKLMAIAYADVVWEKNKVLFSCSKSSNLLWSFYYSETCKNNFFNFCLFLKKYTNNQEFTGVNHLSVIVITYWRWLMIKWPVK